MKAEIISIGSEVLLGEVLDSNSQFLAKELTSLGVEVIRMHTIPDSVDEIVESLDCAINRDKTDILVCTGGLGPTNDDMTCEAVAKFLNVDLHEDPRSLLYLQERVELLNIIDESRTRTLNAQRRKMALMPAGGVPLFNPTGAAPGLWYERENQILLCLPGVPIEMMAIWEVEARPRLKEFTEGLGYAVRHFIVHFSDESALAPIVADAQSHFPLVHFKTRPKRVGTSWEMKLDVAQFISDKHPSHLDEAVKYLTDRLRQSGIKWNDRDE